ncbi:hypothetical protein ACJZ2D_003316 [Fusarium nematophilum]
MRCSTLAQGVFGCQTRLSHAGGILWRHRAAWSFLDVDYVGVRVAIDKSVGLFHVFSASMGIETAMTYAGMAEKGMTFNIDCGINESGPDEFNDIHTPREGRIDIIESRFGTECLTRSRPVRMSRLEAKRGRTVTQATTTRPLDLWNIPVLRNWPIC